MSKETASNVVSNLKINCCKTPLYATGSFGDSAMSQSKTFSGTNSSNVIIYRKWFRYHFVQAHCKCTSKFETNRFKKSFNRVVYYCLKKMTVGSLWGNNVFLNLWHSHYTLCVLRSDSSISKILLLCLVYIVSTLPQFLFINRSSSPSMKSTRLVS